MKRCTRCGGEKPRSDFNRSARNVDGLHAYCRECQKAHYRGNRSRHVRNVRRTRLARQIKIRTYLAGVLVSGCVDCGIHDIRVLEFDHVRGTKLGAVSSLYRAGKSFQTIKDEVAKCEVRCRNCHAIATATRRGSTWFDVFAEESPRRDSNSRHDG